MANSNFTLTLLTSETPQRVFQSIMNVRDWWSGYHSEEFEGATEKLHDEFTFSAAGGAHYCKVKLVEVVPDEKVVWLVTESDLSFLKNRYEWTGTRVSFKISDEGGKTNLLFTHEGLTPEVECYETCAPSWRAYLQNRLLPLINMRA